MNASTDHLLDITTYGAVADVQTDNTAAIQRALDDAAAVQGTVLVPNGVFLSSSLKMHPNTGIMGYATWGYQRGGGSVIRLTDPDAHCLIDITGAIGATIHGLSLQGGDLGSDVHGIYYAPVPDKKEEDAPRIERCHISHFTGDGIHLGSIWCFSLRSCEIIFNKKNGLLCNGWDGFILDNWLSGNGEAGYRATEPNASVTMTGNRIEWNQKGGIHILGGSQYNITGNYIDRSGGPAISLLPRGNAPSAIFAITGNVIYRSGRPEWTPDDYTSCHVTLDHAHGVTMTGNSFCVGQDDWGQGTSSPYYGIVLHALKNCIIKDNTLHIGALRELIVDLGEHEETNIIKDNIGSVFTGEGSIWSSPQW